MYPTSNAADDDRSVGHLDSRLRLLAEGSEYFFIFEYQLLPTFRCAYISSAIEAVTGYAPEDFYQDAELTFRIVHPDDLATLQAAIQTIDGTEAIPLRWLRKDGATAATVGGATPVHDETGTITGFEGIAFDITALQHVEMAREADAQRFRSLVQNATDLIAILDSDGATVYISPSVTATLGYAPEDLIGRSPLELAHSDDLADLASTLSPGASSMELRIRHRDGSWRWFELTVTDLTQDPAVQGRVVNARDITEQRRFEAELAHHALHDRLTNLPNRALLLDRIQSALERLPATGIVAVIGIALDRFSAVNESLGPQAGDELLIAVAGRLQGGLHSHETLSRTTGDEFVVAAEVHDTVEAVALANRLIERLTTPFRIGGRAVHVKACAGVAVAEERTADAGTLLRSAHLACSRAKSAGGGRIATFEESMGEAALQRLELEQALRVALERDELRVFYQPVVDFESGRIVGSEALIRWEHPERGMISPAEFIPLAEETGLIVPIGGWIFDQACFTTAAWTKQFGRPLSVSVNLSVRQFAHPHLFDDLARSLTSSGIDPRLVSLEITESVLIEENEYVFETLVALRALRVRLSLDDFGTRYSSLSYLRRFPFDTLKIDQSFVAGLVDDARDRAIVQSVISLAEGLNLRVVAEGVETASQFERLRALGANRAQGYFLAKPLPATEFERLVESDPRW